jgi:oxygen-independent coproporphyrinogen-3 oxidase
LTRDERQTYLRYACLALPRHTSYPIASEWHDDYDANQFRADLYRVGNERRPLSLYVHVPFCERLCYFCACTKEIVPQRRRTRNDPAPVLLDGLEAESDHFAQAAGTGTVHQLHLGGGSPTFLSPPQLERLWGILSNRFVLARDAEIAVEVDPRITTREHLETLRALGFNRISLGIQDFHPQVQRLVNRIQPFALVERFVEWCRSLHFESINFDLIYGLPLQTIATMADTLDKTIALSPDRIAFYRLAVIPEMFRWQRVFRPSDLPTGELALELNLLAINRFLEAGYEFIGLDHFAKTTEALSRARDAGTLQRNFQGMTTGKSLHVLGLGPSAVSQLDESFAQNKKATLEWRDLVDQTFATERGRRLTADDRLRRELLQQLYCRGTIDKRKLEAAFGIAFNEYFADELVRLRTLVDDGLVVNEPDALDLTTPLGRLLVRVVAAVFDRYVPATAFREGLPTRRASRVG